MPELFFQAYENLQGNPIGNAVDTPLDSHWQEGPQSFGQGCAQTFLEILTLNN